MMELRAYYFGNFYLSSIQQGIQALHVTTEMYNKYQGYNTPARDMLEDWADKYKTVVLLNGGDQATLFETLGDLEPHFKTLGLPYAFFREEESALNCSLTSFGVVLPEAVYDFKFNWQTLDEKVMAAMAISQVLQNFRLAN